MLDKLLDKMVISKARSAMPSNTEGEIRDAIEAVRSAPSVEAFADEVSKLMTAQQLGAPYAAVAHTIVAVMLVESFRKSAGQDLLKLVLSMGRGDESDWIVPVTYFTEWKRDLDLSLDEIRRLVVGDSPRVRSDERISQFDTLTVSLIAQQTQMSEYAARLINDWVNGKFLHNESVNIDECRAAVNLGDGGVAGSLGTMYRGKAAIGAVAYCAKDYHDSPTVKVGRLDGLDLSREDSDLITEFFRLVFADEYPKFKHYFISLLFVKEGPNAFAVTEFSQRLNLNWSQKICSPEQSCALVDSYFLEAHRKYDLKLEKATTGGLILTYNGSTFQRK